MTVSKRGKVGSGELDAETVARIRADIARWRPGVWAEENDYGPQCRCGAIAATWPAEGGGTPNGKCERHAEPADQDDLPADRSAP